MKVWTDVWSGDEMVSDSYPHKLIFNDACLEVKAKFTTKGSDFVAIASDDVNEDDGEGETVINVVDAHRLVEFEVSKADAMQMIKALMKRTMGYLKENGKEDRVAGFKQGATEFVKFVMGKYDEMQIFMGESSDDTASLAFAYTKDGETDPTFLFFVDCTKEKKF